MLRWPRRARHPRGTAVAPGSERGASSIEYALLVAAVAAVLVAVLLGVASIVRDAFSNTDDCFRNGGTSSNCASPSP